MKRFFILLISIWMLMFSSLCFAEVEFPKENYENYYKGNRSYPIVFASMGYGYALDMYSVRMKGNDTNEFLADIHEIDMTTNHMKPNPMHIFARFNPKRGSFGIGFLDSATSEPDNLMLFNSAHLNKGTSETGLLFFAGRGLWEGYTGVPFYREYPMLKPVSESGGPSLIQVNEKTKYGRLSYDQAEVHMLKSSGMEIYTVSFKPEYFVIKSVYADNEQIQARLEKEEVGTIMYYEDNPRIRLVANYMGIGPKLTREQIAAVGAY